MKYIFFLGVILIHLQSFCQRPTGLSPVQPKVITRDYISDIPMTYPFAGPVGAITVNPFTSQHIVIASESGGIFETKNALSPDRKWTHLDEFNHYVVEDVLLKSAPGGFELWAVTSSTFKNVRKPLIWKRKVNGQWVQASFFKTQDNNLDVAITNTYRIIKNDYYDGRMYACGDYGIAIKENNSDSWVIKKLPQNLPVYSIACTREGDIVAATEQGIYVSNARSNGDNWVLKSNAFVANMNRHRFRLNSDPGGNILLAVITDPDGQNYRLICSVDRGESWQPFLTTAAPVKVKAGGYVSVYPFFDVVKKRLTIYMSNQYEFNYAVSTGNNIQEALITMQQNALLAWKGKLNGSQIGHDDTRHLVILTNGTVVPKMIITSDGGLHIADITGEAPESFRWVTENTRSGLKSSQVVNITGDGNTFYFGTWHTGFGASTDGGKTFYSGASAEKKIFGGEGYVVPMNGAPGHYYSQPIVGGDLKFSKKIFGLDTNPETRWPGPSDGDSHWGPVYLLNNTFIQQCVRISPNTLFPWKLTYDNGRSWTEIKGTLYERFGFGCFARTSATSSKFNYFTCLNDNGTLKIGRLTDYYPGNEVQWTYPELRGLEGGVGLFNIGHGTETGIFSVNPFNRSHMIAVEQSTGKLKISHDGGNNWTESRSFTTLYEDWNRNLFKNNIGANAVFCVSFSPFVENVALAATISEGVFLTKDGGLTWKKLNNPGVLLPTAFYWHSADVIFLSTFGRGIFKINLSTND